ncbi:hypothetical protein LQ953_10630 [Sphingomonas sp. IC-56]|uniref:hypothetical protein n=1 Tax=Sphingomonas sp. IC-56 TaxID=2898529 RepID=UPI001E3D0F64|nr:hypothetical protein [Sphingomonas sp. IC-56]MCD2324468.1 hypothetical protein [Sphingomonas sp. IC-56]
MTTQAQSTSLGARLALLAIFMITVFPITLLGVGLSGGKLLSISLIVRDLFTLDARLFLRLFAWMALLTPLIWSALLFRRWRSRRENRAVR